MDFILSRIPRFFSYPKLSSSCIETPEIKVFRFSFPLRLEDSSALILSMYTIISKNQNTLILTISLRIMFNLRIF